MADELREIMDAMRTRIQAELDAQIESLTAQHAAALEQAVQQAAQTAEAEAETRWASKVDALRNEWNARLQSEVATAREEAEKRLVAESVRARADAEKVAADSALRAKEELDHAVAAERQRAEAALADERRRSQQQIEQMRAALDAERAQLEAEAAARRAPSGIDAGALLKTARTIDDARSLSEALIALVTGAGSYAPRVALFLINGSQLEEWPIPGIPPTHTSLAIASPGAGALSAAVRGGAPVVVAQGDPQRSAPSFANLPPDRSAIAIPLLIDDQPVAVLYADEGQALTAHAAEGWMQSVELLTRYTAACVAHLTAVRTLQLLQGRNGNHAAAGATSDDDLSARRYAKLLVSEIKLYNEAAVRIGRENRDLATRLNAEIDRARRLYEARVSPSVAARGFYFQEELVHTLAGGDASLFGG